MERLLLKPARRLQKPRAVFTGGFGLTCTSCQHHAFLKSSRVRGFTTEPTTESLNESPNEFLAASSTGPFLPDTNFDRTPFYVTTPIFYVNAAPHIGHLYSMLIADSLKRWNALSGRKSLLLTGTDEHGLKVQRAAAANEKSPEEWCSMQAEKFRELAEKANIANDFFIRTTDEDHKNAVRHFWYLLKQSGYVYEAKHEGWYCVSDETFYTENQVHKKQDPITGRVYPASNETGNEVEWMEEKTYHFQLTALKDRLLEFYKQNPTWVVPDFRMKEVVHWVENNLEDLSISRPASRLQWGIRVPDDESHTIYVWVDALVNYLTKAGFPNWTPGKEKEGGWPADMQVIGKDILRFHGVYWPAMLLAVGIPPPKKIISHGHWTLGGQKMSKSLGNVVSPFHAMRRWGVDIVRYFMLWEGAINRDASYDNDLIAQRYKKNLQGGMGNLLTRITRPKMWSVRESVYVSCPWVAASHKSKVDMSDAIVMKRVRRTQIAKKAIDLLRRRMTGFMEVGEPGRALKVLQSYVTDSNLALSHGAPWQLSKLLSDLTKDEDIQLAKAELNMTVFDSAESLRHIGILLQPFMPEKAKEMLDVLGVRESRRSFENLGYGMDSTYGEPLKDPGRSSQDSIFPPFEVHG